MSSHTLALVLAVALGGAPLLGCGNPSIDMKVALLGGEVPGVTPGPYHRPGQPCLECHGVYGGATPLMSVAGTIFAAPTDGLPTPVEGVNLTITDAFGSHNGAVPTAASPDKKTNCVGNFYFTMDEYDPGFPLEAKIDCPTVQGGMPGAARYMSSRVSREGSCSGCHQGKRSETSPGWVFCVDTVAASPFKPPGADCPGVPAQ